LYNCFFKKLNYLLDPPFDPPFEEPFDPPLEEPFDPPFEELFEVAMFFRI
jgi:hypothetical protein